MDYAIAAVKALITRGNRFLVVKQKIGNNSLWDLPGGKVDQDENPYDTLRREVSEETCMEVRIEKPIGIYWFFRIKDGMEIVCSTFLCTPEDLEVDTSHNPGEENIIEARWVTKEEFLKEEYVVSHESLKELIKKV